MRICVLETDTNMDSELRVHGTIPFMFQRWLAPALPEAEWHEIAVHEGADLPANEAFDAYLITGSRHGVYDDLPWMAPLAAFIRQAGVAGVPVGGICFGHQIMAHAYGGQVEKSEDGWILGAETYDGHTAFAMHQDRVTRLPESAEEVVGSNRCDVGRIVYDVPAMSVQYHPEFDRAFMAQLLDMYEDEIDAEKISRARVSLDEALHVDEIAGAFAQLLRKQ